jgi:hypothetical protein
LQSNESEIETIGLELGSTLDRSVIDNYIKSVKDRMRVGEMLLEYRVGI